MTLPTDIFPEDKIDPTVKKQNEMSVEDTLGIIGHLRRATKNRSLWRYLVVSGEEDGAAHVRVTYDLPATAPVAHKGQEWAVWAGEGAPSCPAFEEIETLQPEPLPIQPEPIQPEPLRLQPDRNHIEEGLLSQEGMQLYKMSTNTNFTEPVRMLLLRMSDMLHAEAAKISLARVRQAVDRAK
jgi:hypothetical protein